MVGVDRRTGVAAAVTAVAVVALGWAIGSTIPQLNTRRLVAVAAGYGILLSTSGVVVTGALRFAGADVSEEEADTGRAVGKVENVLILTLTLLGAYTALGLVFTAKSIVRWQDISSGNTTYYLTGSIANVTYSLVVGVGLEPLLAAV